MAHIPFFHYSIILIKPKVDHILSKSSQTHRRPFNSTLGTQSTGCQDVAEPILYFIIQPERVHEAVETIIIM